LDSLQSLDFSEYEDLLSLMKILQVAKADDLKGLRSFLLEQGGLIVRRLSEFEKLVGTSKFIKLATVAKI
jgi:hypothetical protein